jgi:hypothetical protein
MFALLGIGAESKCLDCAYGINFVTFPFHVLSAWLDVFLKSHYWRSFLNLLAPEFDI